LTPPRGARALARSDLDPHQILRYGDRAISTQFHPEFTASTMRAYLDAREDVLQGEDYDVEKLRGEVRETPDARELLARFAVYALSLRMKAAKAAIHGQQLRDRTPQKKREISNHSGTS
ncbi:MAG: hypothetical protein ABIY40_04495, partial [Rhodanobacteraceae bacterium]